MVRWFAVKSCGESVEVGAMVISTDLFRVVSSRQSFVFELRTAEVIRWVNNIFLSCKQEHKCPDQGTRWHWIKNNTRGNIKRGKGAGKYDIGAWTGKDGAQWLDAITEVNLLICQSLTSSESFPFWLNDILRYEPKIDNLRVMVERSNSCSFFFFSSSAASSFSLIFCRSFSSCALAILLICRLSFLEVSLLASISLLATPENDAWRCNRLVLLDTWVKTGFDYGG